jgi:hypothetical protein
LAATLEQLPPTVPGEFRQFAADALPRVRLIAPAGVQPFTDDHAPVEQVVHRIIWDFLSGG